MVCLCLTMGGITKKIKHQREMGHFQVKQQGCGSSYKILFSNELHITFLTSNPLQAHVSEEPYPEYIQTKVSPKDSFLNYLSYSG